MFGIRIEFICAFSMYSYLLPKTPLSSVFESPIHAAGAPDADGAGVAARHPVSVDRANLTGLVLGCSEAKFCKKICV